MTDDEFPGSPSDPDLPELPADADPMALLAFLQRVITTMSTGGDVAALMADAPPGFEQLFAAAQRRAEAGDVPDLGMMMGMFGMEDDEDDPEDAPPR